MKEETILAIDQNRFELFENLSISLEEPCKDRANPILTCGSLGSPDDHRVQYNGTIYFDKGSYKLWYVAFDSNFNSNIAYAKSQDGIIWEKPALGLKEYRDSTENNLVGGLPKNTDCISVIKDDDGLFKAAIMNLYGLERNHVDSKFHRYWDSENRSPAFMGIAVSTDGINWEFQEKNRPAIAEKIETCRLSKINGTYVINAQQAFPWTGNEWKGRKVTFFSSKDLKNWTKEEPVYQNEKCQCHVGITEVKKAGGTIVGLCGRFSDAPEIPDQHFEIGLVVSQDAINWKEPAPDQSFIRRGDVGSWDAGGVIQGQGMIEKDGITHIFYSGTKIGNTPFSVTEIGRVSFPENRFGYAALKVGWNLGFRGMRRGMLMTHSINIFPSSGFILMLNAKNFGRGGFIKAAVCNERGKALNGYSEDDCDVINREGTEIAVSWIGRRIIRTENPFKIALFFHGGTYRMESPFLYSFSIKEARDEDHL